MPIINLKYQHYWFLSVTGIGITGLIGTLVCLYTAPRPEVPEQEKAASRILSNAANEIAKPHAPAFTLSVSDASILPPECFGAPSFSTNNASDIVIEDANEKKIIVGRNRSTVSCLREAAANLLASNSESDFSGPTKGFAALTLFGFCMMTIVGTAIGRQERKAKNLSPGPTTCKLA